MLRSLKIFLMILGLGSFIFPQQMLAVQTPQECCIESSTACTDHSTNEEEGCHSGKTSDSENDCKSGCDACYACMAQYIPVILSTTFDNPQAVFYYGDKSTFKYSVSYFSNSIQNIWQPPKIG